MIHKALETDKLISDSIVINHKQVCLFIQFQGLGLYAIDNNLNLKENCIHGCIPPFFIKVPLPCYQNMLIKGKK